MCSSNQGGLKETGVLKKLEGFLNSLTSLVCITFKHDFEPVCGSQKELVLVLFLNLLHATTAQTFEFSGDL